MRRILIILMCLCLMCVPVQASQKDKYVALTFDDGPSGKFTRRLLSGLEQRDVRATFLLCGYRLKEYQDTAQAIFDAGHEIGLHGYSHKCMGCMTVEAVTRELRNTMELLPEGCCPVFLRPPGGRSNAAVRQAAQEGGYAILSWSVDPKDWAVSDKSVIVRRVVEQAKDGDVILLHDMSVSSVDAALEIVDILTRQGYCFVTASELAALNGITPQPGKTYERFIG